VSITVHPRRTFIPARSARMLAILLMAGPFALSAPVSSQEPGATAIPTGQPIGWTERLREARRLYYEGLEDRSASEQAQELFESMYQEDPEESLVTAYLGSCILLESARTWAVWKKGKLAREGIEMMDRAVASAPGSVEIRFLRGASTRRVPAFFGLGERPEQDLAWAAERAETAWAEGRLEAGLAAAAFFYHGEYRESAGDVSAAREAWRKAARLAPDSRAGRSAAEQLDRTGGRDEREGREPGA
jgi:tetratricopeptide (TPR) repeat protein